jgi:hypothetical protein
MVFIVVQLIYIVKASNKIISHNELEDNTSERFGEIMRPVDKNNKLNKVDKPGRR